MSLTTGELSAADIAAVMGNRNDGGFGGDSSGWWILLLFLCLFNGGWGGNYGGGSNGGNGFVPYYLANNTDNGVQAGFNNAALTSQLTGIQSAITSGFANAEIAGCNRAMADMERSFASQTAITGGLTGLSSQLAQCCCNQSANTADLKYTIATEACASRANSTDNTRAILDKLCQLELDNVKAQVEAKNDIISQLRADLIYAKGQASQDVQTAQILAGQTAEVDALYNRLNNCPVNTVPVYGRQPIFSCNQNSGCGCNGNFYN